MEIVEASEFKHTTLDRHPTTVVGVTLLDESPGFTGIYVRDPRGGLWPARTVSHTPASHHADVCNAWLEGPGIHEDKRTSAATPVKGI